MNRKKYLTILLAVTILLTLTTLIVIFATHFKNQNSTNIHKSNQTNIFIETPNYENESDQNLDKVEAENISEIVSLNDIYSKFYNKATEILNNMTLEEKVGQLFLARYPEEDANTEIEENHPGGYILFAKDFINETKDSIISKLKHNQENSKIKMILGVDEEGGTVTRVSKYKQFRNTKFKSPQELFNEGGMNKIIDDSAEKSNLLKELGINMNLAPVVDISTNPKAFIYDRTLGKSPEETAEYTKNIVQSMNEHGIISTLKHFPGYGDNIDTHTEIATDERPYESFINTDFIPFRSGIEAGAPTVLVNHNIVKSMDPNFPASLSDNVHRILREDLKFSGLIITDDLAMNAVKSYVENGQSAVRAVLAGNDMIISSNFTKQRDEVLEAIKDGTISEDIINRAVIRILACKMNYGIIK